MKTNNNNETGEPLKRLFAACVSFSRLEEQQTEIVYAFSHLLQTQHSKRRWRRARKEREKLLWFCCCCCCEPFIKLCSVIFHFRFMIFRQDKEFEVQLYLTPRTFLSCRSWCDDSSHIEIPYFRRMQAHMLSHRSHEFVANRMSREIGMWWRSWWHSNIHALYVARHTEQLKNEYGKFHSLNETILLLAPQSFKYSCLTAQLQKIISQYRLRDMQQI